MDAGPSEVIEDSLDDGVENEGTEDVGPETEDQSENTTILNLDVVMAEPSELIDEEFQVLESEKGPLNMRRFSKSEMELYNVSIKTELFTKRQLYM